MAVWKQTLGLGLINLLVIGFIACPTGVTHDWDGILYGCNLITLQASKLPKKQLLLCLPGDESLHCFWSKSFVLHQMGQDLVAQIMR